ncbi:MAG: ssDNA-binding domain-containing protein [Oscillospiraceae bacterium]|jgi:antirestriction protein ArdC|nr:ssDNA-binding domain-containing protein [Oscillospiraceae bacterium]
MTTTTPIALTADNPRDRLREITDKLEQGVRDIFDSERYKECLNTLSKFHDYSLNNNLLIAMQRPGATYVAGFRAWQSNFKRNVKSGEKGIKIIAPAPIKVTAEKTQIDPQSGVSTASTEEVVVPRFRVVTVFDVSQTEGKPLPEIADELTGDADVYGEKLSALMKISRVPVAFEEISGGARGYYDQIEKRIAIKSGMSELQTLKTAVHELAHSRLHDVDKSAPKDTPRPGRRTREVEAESVAYIVCRHLGLDTSDYSFGYIASYSADKELAELKASLGTIKDEASAIIAEIDASLAAPEKDAAPQYRDEEAAAGGDQTDREDRDEFGNWDGNPTPYYLRGSKDSRQTGNSRTEYETTLEM